MMVDIQPFDGSPIAGSKQSWLGSREGVSTARTGTLVGFSGVVESGTPVSEVGGDYVPYVPGDETTPGPGLAGFVIHDTHVREGRDTVAAILDRGRIRTDRLPVAFVAPADSGRFTFVSDA